MTRVELEELLSAYMDGELSPQNMKKVETLVKTNAQAKSILDGYLSVRKAIQHEAKALKYKAPAGFASGVLAAIDPPCIRHTRPIQDKVISRWSNPRIFAYPLAILVCALLIGIIYRPDTSDTTPPIAQRTLVSEQLTISSSIDTRQQDEPIIYPPLPGDAGTIFLSEKPVQPEKTDLKLVCRAENTVSVSTLFTRVFATHNIVSNRSTLGGHVVYEISVTPDTLREILEEFQANSVEITGNTEDLGTKEPIKVCFQVE